MRVDARERRDVALHGGGGASDERVRGPAHLAHLGHEERRHAKVHVDEEPGHLAEDVARQLEKRHAGLRADERGLVLLALLAPPGHARVRHHVVRRRDVQHLLDGAVDPGRHHRAHHAVQPRRVAEVLGERDELGVGARVDDHVRTRLQQPAHHRAPDGAHAADDESGFAAQHGERSRGGIGVGSGMRMRSESEGPLPVLTWRNYGRCTDLKTARN